MSYIELSIEERASIQVGQAQGMSLRHIAKLLRRAPSTISREIRRNNGPEQLLCPVRPASAGKASSGLPSDA